jgi:hypothetical protein
MNSILTVGNALLSCGHHATVFPKPIQTKKNFGLYRGFPFCSAFTEATRGGSNKTLTTVPL